MEDSRHRHPLAPAGLFVVRSEAEQRCGEGTDRARQALGAAVVGDVSDQGGVEHAQQGVREEVDVQVRVRPREQPGDVVVPAQVGRALERVAEAVAALAGRRVTGKAVLDVLGVRDVPEVRTRRDRS